jgi:succinoglycan biosynthesis protein ExoM
VGVDLTLIVADNEPVPGNQQTVAEFAATSPFPVVYVHEPRRGISRARNAVLVACEARFDWIAFTDDDCRPAPDWIATLLAAAERHGADVVYGRREWVPPDPVPFWYEPPELARRTEGQVLEFAATHNVMMAGRFAGLRFDERLAHGEDTDFFFRATLRGARIVYSAEPVVYETVPPHRATLRYQIVRSFYFAASRTAFHRRYKGLDGAAAKVLFRLVWQVPIAVIRLVTAPLVWPFSKRQFRYQVTKGVGRL